MKDKDAQDFQVQGATRGRLDLLGIAVPCGQGERPESRERTYAPRPASAVLKL